MSGVHGTYLFGRRSHPAKPISSGGADGQAIRWRPGERFHHLFEERCDRLRRTGRGGKAAADAGGETITYDELDARANRLARYLVRRGARAGDRVALLFDQAVCGYVGMLAVSKLNATYVPLDAAFPADRIGYIARDAGVRFVLTQAHLREAATRCGDGVTAVYVDEAAERIAAEDGGRLTEAETGGPADDICYIIYTSGSTGRPKGVAITHAAICNFVRVAAETYGLLPEDRVYQGMTVAFDFSVEEIWVPLLVGATLVPKPAGTTLIGDELHAFLRANRVTALCCVPTLLATLDEELPELRFLLVSGEACPADLVARWYRPGRRFLNVYGPTEATVTATWAVLHPDRPVTLGVPLPTYTVVILDPAEDRELPRGELGEIGIAGVGLARGYVNRDDLTRRAFIPDFLGIPDNPSRRIYRTGDLGRVNDDGEIEYHGRIDTQVKVQGYRIELDEIESVLRQVPGIAQAVVGTHEPEPGVTELVAYYTAANGEVDHAEVYRRLRDRLPGYMIPAYLERLPAIPMLPSDKADRKSLPPPKGPRSLSTGRPGTPPTTPAERLIADALAYVLRLDQVCVDSDFFTDLGANSLLMARFCAQVRKRVSGTSLSMKDVYLHPTTRGLATVLAERAAGDVAERADSGPANEGRRGLARNGAESVGESRTASGEIAGPVGEGRPGAALPSADAAGSDAGRGYAGSPGGGRGESRSDLAVGGPVSEGRFGAGSWGAEALQREAERERADLMGSGRRRPDQEIAARVSGGPPAAGRRDTGPVGAAQYLLSGAIQVLLFLGYAYLTSLVIVRCYEWISAASGLGEVYLRSLAAGGAIFVGLCVLPILVKWVVIGRWRPGEIRIWSLPYVRFWAVKTLIRGSPLALFVGSPLYVLYLRALGAKIGPGVTILSRAVPVCTDLLTIGGGTIVRKDTYLSCYRPRGGVIQLGPVRIGEDVYVGEATVLDIHTAIGDGAQLGHASCLQSGQSIPAGEHWHGTPAEPTTADYRTVPPARCGPLRRFLFGATQLVTTLTVAVPLAIGGGYLVATRIPALDKIMEGRPAGPAEAVFYLDALVISGVLFFGTLVAGLAFVATVPRLLRLVVRPGRTYPLYGLRHWAHRKVARITNSPFYTTLFGDSSFIVHYLRFLGYDLSSRIEQTGSNFGAELKHETPYLAHVGTGTMVSDGLSIVNADYSSTSFRLAHATIGEHGFLGNDVVYPAQSTVGGNCLLATKTLIPIDGPPRRDVGLLGSPPFEIPRSVARDTEIARRAAADRPRRLAAKNAHNARTLGLFLLVGYVNTLLVTLFALLAAARFADLGALAIAAGMLGALVVTVAFLLLAERAIAGFRPLRPRTCSIYDPYYWWHERYWKISSLTPFMLFNGTPLKPVLLRLAGAHVGRRVFDDGCGIPERSLVTVGDGAALAEGSVLQCHSLEEGAFKSDRIRIGAGCTIGTKAFVHYGVTMGDGAVLEADAFLMKGEEADPYAVWQGNPANPAQ